MRGRIDGRLGKKIFFLVRIFIKIGFLQISIFFFFWVSQENYNSCNVILDAISLRKEGETEKI